MGRASNVDWCDSATNPVAGCDGCELWIPEKGVRICYAGVLTERYAGVNPGFPESFTTPKLFPGRMAEAAAWGDLRGKARKGKPWLDGMPRVIFIEDMGDAFSKSVPFDFLHREIIHACHSPKGRRHLWLWLTKQPHRAVEFGRYLEAAGSDWPLNLGLGTSITEARFLSRVRHLLDVPGPRLRFLSVEPVVESTDLQPTGALRWSCEACGARPGTWTNDGFSRVCPMCGSDRPGRGHRIGWVATGGESGAGARPCDLAHLRGLKAQCESAEVPVFVKQVGTRPALEMEPTGDFRTNPGTGSRQFKVHLRLLPTTDRKGADWNEWPADLRVRQMSNWHWTPEGGAEWA